MYQFRLHATIFLLLVFPFFIGAEESPDKPTACILTFSVNWDENPDLEQVFLDSLGIELEKKGFAIHTASLGRRETSAPPNVDRISKFPESDIVFAVGYRGSGGKISVDLKILSGFSSDVLASISRELSIDLFLDQQILEFMREAITLLPGTIKDIAVGEQSLRATERQRREQERAELADRTDMAAVGEELYYNGFELKVGLAPHIIIESGPGLPESGISFNLIVEYRIRLERYQWIFGAHSGLEWMGSWQDSGMGEGYVVPLMIVSGIGTRGLGFIEFYAIAAGGPAVTMLMAPSGGSNLDVAIAAHAGIGAEIGLGRGLHVDLGGSAFLLQHGGGLRWGLKPFLELSLEL